MQLGDGAVDRSGPGPGSLAISVISQHLYWHFRLFLRESGIGRSLHRGGQPKIGYDGAGRVHELLARGRPLGIAVANAQEYPTMQPS